MNEFYERNGRTVFTCFFHSEGKLIAGRIRYRRDGDAWIAEILKYEAAAA